MTIFLHIGTHKTGTTAIQRHLGRNADFYASQGLWYPRESELLEGGREAPTHLNIARSLDCTTKPKPYSEEQLQAMARALVTKASRYAHTIVSAEAFWRIGFGRIDQEEDRELRAPRGWLRRGVVARGADLGLVGRDLLRLLRDEPTARGGHLLERGGVELHVHRRVGVVFVVLQDLWGARLEP